MTEKMYQMISDEKELKWFFDHVIQKPALYESYSMVWVSRHKKLTKEEQATFGLTRAESEFLKVETVRCKKVKSMDVPAEFTFKNFLQHVKRFNVDKEAYTTGNGLPLPEKTLAVIFYVNPCNEMKVADKVIEKINFERSAIMTAVTNGKTWHELGQLYQGLGNLDSDIKHFRAQCKGTSYWMDFDVDVPAWFRDDKIITEVDQDVHTDGHIHLRAYTQRNKYYKQMIEKLNARFGKGNYVIVDTSGGYHILVRTNSIRSNPHDFCKEVEAIYKQGVTDGNLEYLDEKGVCKFEAIVNDSQIPGLPLPGTYQYGRPVTVLNKEDFE